MQRSTPDLELLRRFDTEVWTKLPRFEDGKVTNPTPLVDVTGALLDCAKTEYGLDIGSGRVRVFAKFDSKIPGGSVKVRPAAAIVRDAITKGELVKGQTVFEATSGNFGLALGGMGKIGIDVVALVSRRLQEGVVNSLKPDGVRMINLDMDICPAPGAIGGADLAIAKGVWTSVRQQLGELGFDLQPFDGARTEAEALLARQDVIGLAKLLAKAYEGFCTEQYENNLNVQAHSRVTGPELDQQLAEQGTSLGEVDFVCTFGTGGTAGGVGRYVLSKYKKNAVRVVFPLDGQDVAGIRTKEKAQGLRFYEPESYAGEHQADFEEASKVFEFFNGKGFDVGESGALALYASIQLLNYGVGKEFVVMVADGASKYVPEVQAVARRGKRDQVRLDEAASAIGSYGGIIWAHNTFTPREEGLRAIATSLGCEESAIKVAKATDVQTILDGKDPSEEFEGLLSGDGRPVLVVCIAGNTSLMLAKVLERKGIAAESLVGGIMGLPISKGRQPFDLLQVARG